MESVPPQLYGGTERIVSYLTEELVKLGHDVTLFASGDSVTSAKLVSCAPTALRLDPKVRDVIPYYMLMLDRVRHASPTNSIFCTFIWTICTFHFSGTCLRGSDLFMAGKDLPDNKPIFIGFDEMRLISISDSQRSPISNAGEFCRNHLPRTSLEQILNLPYIPAAAILRFSGA